MALTQIFANQAQSTLAGAITPTSLTANLSPGTGALFPSPGANQYFTMIFNDAATGLLYEEVWVTNVTGDTITMIRGQEGSTALNWAAGDIAFNGWTAGSARNLVQAGQAQSNSFVYAVDTGGAANTYAIALTPSMQTGIDGAIVYFKPAHTNTGASTLTVNAGTSYSLLGAAHSPLQGGEIFLNGFAAAEFNSTLGAYVLLYCTGGAEQVAPALSSGQAVQFGQVSGVVGQSRNAKISILTASATATFTADELIVETALGGLRYCLANVNSSINLATTGIGGMDTGSAPVNGTVAVYEMYNPTSGAKGLVGFNATSVTPGQVYSGANAPAGYTASSLVAILQTNPSGQFKSAFVSGRKVSHASFSVLNTSSGASSGTSLDISSVVPKGATALSGYIVTSNSTTGNATNTLSIGADSSMNGVKTIQLQMTSASGWSGSLSYEGIPISVPQTLFYAASASAGTPNYQITISGYEF
ncbi:hypothetical protein [Herbaspirillum huttiense]|uniref:hypothetical protein n=1 Tax=Herbaspirillum huttiense TaxID=863372 RepID=UPI0031D51FD3